MWGKNNKILKNKLIYKDKKLCCQNHSKKSLHILKDMIAHDVQVGNIEQMRVSNIFKLDQIKLKWWFSIKFCDVALKYIKLQGRL